MSDTNIPKPIGGIDDLEIAAKDAAAQLGKATSHNAIWDKAAKALKQGLSALAKTREDAKAEATQANKLMESLAENYDNDVVSDRIREIRTKVDGDIANLAEAASTAEQALNLAKDEAAAAKRELDESNANAKFEDAQKALLDLPKGIQERQKQVVALEAEVKDAHSKHQLVEAVVKLEDLKKTLENPMALTDPKELAGLKDMIKPEYEAQLWTKLNSAANDLILKTNALLDKQAMVLIREGELSKAKAARDEAQKNRLDAIRKSLADE